MIAQCRIVPITTRFLPALVALVLALLAYSTVAGEDAQPMSEIDGRVTAMASSVFTSADGVATPPSFSLLLETADGPLHVTLAADARVLDERGERIAAGTIPLDARVRAIGESLAPGQFLAHDVILLP